jgi:hypothetical protein
MDYSGSRGLVTLRVLNERGELVAVGQVERKEFIDDLMRSKVITIGLESVGPKPPTPNQSQRG